MYNFGGTHSAHNTIPKLYFKTEQKRSSCRGSVVRNPTSIHEDAGSIPGLTQGVKDLILLWCRLQMRLRSGVAVAVV